MTPAEELDPREQVDRELLELVFHSAWRAILIVLPFSVLCAYFLRDTLPPAFLRPHRFRVPVRSINLLE